MRPVLLSLLIFVNQSQADDWHMHRGNPARLGATSEKLSTPLYRAWSYSAPSQIRMAWSGPNQRTIEGNKLRHRVNYDDAFRVAVADQRLYFGSSVDHRVYCKDLQSGMTLWSFFTGGPVRLAPTVTEGQVYVGSDDGYVYSLDAKTGKLIWKLRAGPMDEWILARGEMISRWPVRTGVLVDKGQAFFGAGIFPHEDIYLYCVDAKTGKIIWKRDTISETDAGRNDISPQGYFLVNDEYLIVPSGRSLPAVLERKTGKVLHKKRLSWRREGVVGGSRAILSDGQLYVAGPHQYVALEEKSGKTGFGWFDCKEMSIFGDDACLIDGETVRRIDRRIYGKATALRQKLKNQITSWSRTLRSNPKNADELKAKIKKANAEEKELAGKGVKWSTPLASEGALIVAGNLVVVGGKGKIDALDLESGKILWTEKLDGEVRGIVVANGHLVASTNTGGVHVYSTQKRESASTTKLVENPYPKDELSELYAQTAKDLLKKADTDRGFCLVVGAEQGRLAFELAKQSKLKIYGIEADAKKAQLAREKLASAGVYGHRVTIHQADLNDIPYSNYFANLIVSDSLLLTGKVPGDPERIVRHLKPIGGKIVLGSPKGNLEMTTLRDWLKSTDLKEAGSINTERNFVTLTRDRLPGAGDWSHQYGEPGNTASSMDYRVKGGLGVLWYGDPGPGEMVNRHEGAVGPLSVHGRLIIQGQYSVLAYDAYNGTFLWEFKNPSTYRTGVFQNWSPGNLAASRKSVFIMNGAEVVELDAETGKEKAIHQLPEEKRKDCEWGFLAHKNGILYGTATIRKELARKLKRRGKKFDDATDMLFAIDLKSGKTLWTYQGASIEARTLAIGPKRVYFIDSTITSDQREELLKQDKTELKKLKGEEAKKAEERMKRLDARVATALDARTGEKLWSKAVDVTDTSNIGIGGGKLTLMYHNGTLILGGANANGHYWKQFVAGEFSRRRLVALNANNGKKLWAKDGNYRHRPIIIGDRVIAEPWSFELRSGKQETRTHPLTGKEVPWSMIRPGHHCGMLTGCPNMLMFRSGFTGFYDLYADAGTRHFAGHRLGCWINAIPANGLVMVPEASAGCVCLFSIASTIVMEPREARRPWTIYSAVGKSTPVQHMALNLGAPGDRKDAYGQVWLAYPRPVPGKETGLDLKLDLKEKKPSGSEYKSINARANDIAGTPTSWLYTSQAKGVTKFILPLLGKEDKPTSYKVQLHFAELEEDIKAGQRVFDIKIQDKVVLKGVDIVKDAGAVRKAIIKELGNINVEKNLIIELVPKSGKPPVLNAVQVTRN